MIVNVQKILVRDFYKILNEVKTGEVPPALDMPDSFEQLVTDMKSNQYDAKTFAFMLRGMVSCVMLALSIQMFSIYLTYIENTRFRH